MSPGASFAGQELAQGLCAQNLSPDCLQLAGEVQTPVLPAAQRWPAPTSSQTAYSAAVSRRPASTAGVDLTKFARDDHGHIRHLTNEEWVYVKTHDIEAIADNFTDAEMEVLLAYMEDAVAQQQGKGLARR